MGIVRTLIFFHNSAVPYFTFPLRDLHADAGGEIIMRCVAMGVPLPRYAWYKNGQPLHSVPGDIEVKVNTVVIKSANKTRHSGMYQCSASNVYGTRLSSAQLRVLGQFCQNNAHLYEFYRLKEYVASFTD